MTKAPERAIYNKWDGLESAGPWTPVDGDAEYIRLDLHEAAVAAARAEGMRIKPLVWRVYSQNGNCDASTPFGPYSVEDCYEDGWGMWTPQEYGGGDDPANGFHETKEAAQAAAQADFDARIRSVCEAPQ